MTPIAQTVRLSSTPARNPSPPNFGFFGPAKLHSLKFGIFSAVYVTESRFTSAASEMVEIRRATTAAEMLRCPSDKNSASSTIFRRRLHGGTFKAISQIFVFESAIES